MALYTKKTPVYRILAGFNTGQDSDPAFYLNADSDPNPGSQIIRIHVDPDPCRHTKRLIFTLKIYFMKVPVMIYET